VTPLRVFVEGTPLFRQRTGVGQYTKYLLEALFRLDDWADPRALDALGDRERLIAELAAGDFIEMRA